MPTPDRSSGDRSGAPAGTGPGDHWNRLTRVLRLQINAGWWLASWLPAVLGVGIVGTFALVWARWRDDTLVAPVWIAIGLGFVAAAVAALVVARSRFESVAGARIRLEDALGLHTRLSAAAAGVGPWPQRRLDLAGRWPVAWRWQRPVGMLALVGAMLSAAAIVPVARARGPQRDVIERPHDADVVSRMNDQLRLHHTITEQSADEIDETLAALVERPRDRWYEHSSLEAAGTLREQVVADLEKLSRNLATAAAAAEALAEVTQQATPEQRAAAAAELARAALELGACPIQPQADVGRAELSGLSKEQLRELAKNLKANRARLAAALAKAGAVPLDLAGGDGEEDGDGNEDGDGDGQCDGDGHCPDCKPCGICSECREGKPCGAVCEHGRSGKKSGRGGTTRGPGSSANRFTDRTQRPATRPERLDGAKDDKRAAPGELIGILEGGVEVDPEEYAGPQEGGAAVDPGSGGSGARVDRLLPAEQEIVRRYFGR
ncbi:MAG: hypothetical protein ACKOEM_19070 [Planctomycetia bacterium]